jgi:peptide/nickel transport system permease protein
LTDPALQAATAGPVAAPGADSSLSTFDSTKARKQSVVVLRRFLRHRLAMISTVVLLLLVLVAFVGGALWKYKYTDLSFLSAQEPSLDHPFGTGELGDDTLSQVLRGTQFSLMIAIIVAFVATSIGVVLGAVAGYFRSWADSVISRFIDLVLVIPQVVLAAVLSASTFNSAGGSNWYLIAVFLGITNWMSIARVIRGMVLSLREKEFVEAARALGGSVPRLIFKHILPNTADVIIVNATITISQAVLLEAALSFIGLGVHSPDTSLGLLINQNDNELGLHNWLFFFPFLFLVLISLTVNFIGDGLRDALDPRQKRVRA